MKRVYTIEEWNKEYATAIRRAKQYQLETEAERKKQEEEEKERENFDITRIWEEGYNG